MYQRLKIEYGSDQRGWVEYKPKFDDPAMFTSIVAYMAAINDAALVDQSCQARLLDQDGNVLAHLIAPYEGVQIDLVTDGATSLDEIRADYGIDKKRFTDMCVAWLKANAQ